MSASDNIETEYNDARIFIQLTQHRVPIRHFDDLRALINNFMF